MSGDADAKIADGAFGEGHGHLVGSTALVGVDGQHPVQGLVRFLGGGVDGDMPVRP